MFHPRRRVIRFTLYENQNPGKPASLRGGVLCCLRTLNAGLDGQALLFCAMKRVL